jgi:hypothetical protein
VTRDELRRAFVRSVIEASSDDTPRLIYASFIRVQVELAQKRGTHADACPCLTCKALRRRERELLRSHSMVWMNETGIRFLCIQFKEEGAVPTVAIGLNSPQTLDAEIVFHRGFVASLHALTLADWCGAKCQHCRGEGHCGRRQPNRPCPSCHGSGRIGGHGPEIAEAAPLEFVTLSDCRPLNRYVNRLMDMNGALVDKGSEIQYVWMKTKPSFEALQQPWILPADLWDALPGATTQERYAVVWKVYATLDEANDAASEAYLAWAKRYSKTTKTPPARSTS